MKFDFKDIDRAREILELEERATLDEIKRNYRVLSKRWHPDKCKEKSKKECHEMMKKINLAYRLIMKYCENYKYSFKEDDVAEEDIEARWMRQFGKDPLWGKGWE